MVMVQTVGQSGQLSEG